VTAVDLKVCWHLMLGLDFLVSGIKYIDC